VNTFIIGLILVLTLAACGPSIPKTQSNSPAPPTSTPQVIAPTATFAPTSTIIAPSPTPDLRVKVTRVINGDTIELEDGQTVRYIGIDTPETVAPGQPVGCFGPEASAKNKEMVNGKAVTLEKDVSETDRFGRLLRYVYLDGQMVNEMLIAEGYAQQSTFPPDVKHQERFRTAQQQAQSQGKGLWTACAATATPVPPTPTVVLVPATPTNVPAPRIQAPTSTPVPPANSNVYYQNCDAARRAGAAPLYRGQPGYRAALDRDNDGVACE